MVGTDFFEASHLVVFSEVDKRMPVLTNFEVVDLAMLVNGCESLHDFDPVSRLL